MLSRPQPTIDPTVNNAVNRIRFAIAQSLKHSPQTKEYNTQRNKNTVLIVCRQITLNPDAPAPTLV